VKLGASPDEAVFCSNPAAVDGRHVVGQIAIRHQWSDGDKDLVVLGELRARGGRGGDPHRVDGNEVGRRCADRGCRRERFMLAISAL